MRKQLVFVLLILIGVCYPLDIFCQEKENPKISFSFDDGSVKNYLGYKNEVWNQLLLDGLKNHDIKAILFVKGKGMDNVEGKEIIRSWDNADHLIGNHTYNHPYFNSNKVCLEQFEMDVLKNDSLIHSYSNFTKTFRFPYLKEGNTIEKRDGFRSFLKEQDYKIGHVTIDASDWYIDKRLIQRLTESQNASISQFKKFYIQHIYDRALFYDSLAFDLTGRRIKHNLLLHHNLSAALFLDDLIQHFKDNGWDIVNAEEAYKDEIYLKVPQNIPAGESLIWALAKQSGNYEDILRYPAEDSRYETEKMDDLGL